MAAESAILAWARKDGLVPIRLEFVLPWKAPELGQPRSHRIARLTVRDNDEVATFWLAYGPCRFGLTLAKEVVPLRRADH